MIHLVDFLIGERLREMHEELEIVSKNVETGALAALLGLDSITTVFPSS